MTNYRNAPQYTVCTNENDRGLGKKALDNKKYVVAILMDLSKAFDCISHDLLIAKLSAYGFEISSLRLIYWTNPRIREGL